MWGCDEMAGANLGDERLNRRLVRLLERLGDKPTASIPQACGGWAETQAAYRFLANDKVDWQAVRAPHWARTVERMQAQAVVLCVQDTTELDFTGQPAIAGLGPLSYAAQHGRYLHPTACGHARGAATGGAGCLDVGARGQDPRPEAPAPAPDRGQGEPALTWKATSAWPSRRPCCPRRAGWMSPTASATSTRSCAGHRAGWRIGR